MYVDDLADACEYFLKKDVKHTHINIGSGQEKSIKDFAKFVMKKLNVNLKIKFDKKTKWHPKKDIKYKFSKKIWLEI